MNALMQNNVSVHIAIQERFKNKSNQKKNPTKESTNSQHLYIRGIYINTSKIKSHLY